MTTGKKFFAIFLICCFALATLLVSAFVYWAHTPVSTQEKPIAFSVPPGNLNTAVRHIAGQGVPINTSLFIALVRITGNDKRLKTGYYKLGQDDTPWELMNNLVNGKFIRGSVTVIEGWNFSQMRKALASHDALLHDTANLSDQELLAKLGISYVGAEGIFFPDTYVFPKGTPETQIFKQAHDAMMKKLDALWQKRDTQLPYATPYHALIMASIVEKETGLASDRDMVAGVFVNRLRIGMRLQTDPTVIYGMGDAYQGNIRKVDLQTDTPYNTYTRNGLPPTPIALPGEAALKAAFQPAVTDALYFVSKGDGSSHFSSNLSEHNSAVNQYQR